MSSAQLPDPTVGFLHALPHQDPTGGLGSLPISDGADILKAPVEITAATEEAWRRLCAKLPPAGAQPRTVNQPPAVAQSRPPLPAPVAPPPQQQQVTLPLAQPRNVAPAPRPPPQQPQPNASIYGDKNTADFSMADRGIQNPANVAPRPPPVAQPPQPSYAAPVVQQQQQWQQPRPAPVYEQQQQEVPLCCHGVPFTQCNYRAQHLEEAQQEAASLSSLLGMKVASGQDIQQTLARIQEVAQLVTRLQSAPPPPAHNYPAPPVQQQQYNQPPQGYNAHQQPYAMQPQQQQQWQQPPPPQQQQYQQYQGPPPQAQNMYQQQAPYAAGGYQADAAGGAYQHQDTSYNNNGPQEQQYAPAGPPSWTIDYDQLHAAKGTAINATNDAKWQAQNFPWSQDLINLNRSQFGNAQFRTNQLQICNATLSNHDVFVLMPTGGGKSLCYQLPALISPGLTIVISPLIALIQDQVAQLGDLGIPTATLSGENVKYPQVMREARSGELKVLFVTPEKLAVSGSLTGLLDDLYANNMFARINYR